LAEYSLQGFLGNGSYAQVRQATHKATNYTVAIKIYDKLKLNENKEVKKSVSREILLLSALSGTARRGVSQSAVSMLSSNFSENNAFETMGEFGRGHPNIMRLFDAIDT
jgi:serine/threonine protein kinase